MAIVKFLYLGIHHLVQMNISYIEKIKVITAAAMAAAMVVVEETEKVSLIVLRGVQHMEIGLVRVLIMKIVQIQLMMVALKVIVHGLVMAIVMMVHMV